jgi:hypothetical protein
VGQIGGRAGSGPSKTGANSGDRATFLLLASGRNVGFFVEGLNLLSVDSAGSTMTEERPPETGIFFAGEMGGVTTARWFRLKNRCI